MSELCYQPLSSSVRFAHLFTIIICRLLCRILVLIRLLFGSVNILLVFNDMGYADRPIRLYALIDFNSKLFGTGCSVVVVLL